MLKYAMMLPVVCFVFLGFALGESFFAMCGFSLLLASTRTWTSGASNLACGASASLSGATAAVVAPMAGMVALTQIGR
jgi:hypothetical protein